VFTIEACKRRSYQKGWNIVGGLEHMGSSQNAEDRCVDEWL